MRNFFTKKVRSVNFKLSKALQAATLKRLCSIDFVHPALGIIIDLGLICDVF